MAFVTLSLRGYWRVNACSSKMQLFFLYASNDCLAQSFALAAMVLLESVCVCVAMRVQQGMSTDVVRIDEGSDLKPADPRPNALHVEQRVSAQLV